MRKNEVDGCNKKIREKLKNLPFGEKTKIYISKDTLTKQTNF